MSQSLMCGEEVVIFGFGGTLVNHKMLFEGNNYYDYSIFLSSYFTWLFINSFIIENFNFRLFISYRPFCTSISVCYFLLSEVLKHVKILKQKKQRYRAPLVL